MSIKTKIFVTLAFIVSAFYLLEVVLTVLSQGLVLPVLTKSLIVVAALSYAIIQIRKNKKPEQEKTGQD